MAIFPGLGDDATAEGFSLVVSAVTYAVLSGIGRFLATRKPTAPPAGSQLPDASQIKALNDQMERADAFHIKQLEAQKALYESHIAFLQRQLDAIKTGDGNHNGGLEDAGRSNKG